MELLLQKGPIAINLGLAGFADALRAQGVPVVSVDWTPPLVDEQTAAILDRLL
ncbi:MAG: hypothetical protein AB1543_02950 [Candidatus Bipolaricaulota bacterium]